ncbi:hypothetical protein DFJ77DRAFT_74935 [Powellomyces hirtus]|nr:hypothetical protein DFJ77DRAFT_74935 [Powellomyces hirtus]
MGVFQRSAGEYDAMDAQYPAGPDELESRRVGSATRATPSHKLGILDVRPRILSNVQWSNEIDKMFTASDLEMSRIPMSLPSPPLQFERVVSDMLRWSGLEKVLDLRLDRQPAHPTERGHLCRVELSVQYDKLQQPQCSGQRQLNQKTLPFVGMVGPVAHGLRHQVAFCYRALRICVVDAAKQAYTLSSNCAPRDNPETPISRADVLNEA